jgi:hypothetical protein
MKIEIVGLNSSNFDIFQRNDKTCKNHQSIRFGMFCKISWKLKAWDFDVGQNIKNVQKILLL